MRRLSHAALIVIALIGLGGCQTAIPAIGDAIGNGLKGIHQFMMSNGEDTPCVLGDESDDLHKEPNE